MASEGLYPSDAFSGTAEAYARFRPPYPEPLLKSLVEKIPHPGTATALDLACGPGRLALPLAHVFQKVWAADLEPEMVAQGERAARQSGLGNLQWRVGLAESLHFPEASISLITIGEAFHRLDQARVCARALQWLVPGGVIATLGSDTFLHGSEPWHRLVQAEVARWVKPRAPTPGATPPQATGPVHDSAVMERSGFVDICTVQITEERIWTAEQIHGYLLSTSTASHRALGANAEAFRRDLISSLLRLNPQNAFRESLRWGYTAGRKPAS